MNNTFYIMATGPSINNITDEEWEFLEDKNTIGFSYFPLKDKKTKYYYSHEYVDGDIISLDRMFNNKFMDTELFLYNDKSIEYAKKLGFKRIHKIHKGTANVNNLNKPYDKYMAKSLSQPIFRPRGQLCAVINIAILLGATEMRLCGVDLNNQHHFYDDYEAYNEITKKQIEIEDKKHKRYGIKNWDRNKIHSTVCKRSDIKITIIDVIKWIKKSLEGKIDIYCCNPNSLLVKENVLEYKSIMEK